MALTIKTAPAVEPITLDEAKLQCRVSTSADDSLIEEKIQSAREWVEDFLWRALITQTWNLILDEWPKGDRIEIPKPPLQSVTSIKYKDKDGNEDTFTNTNYIVDTNSEPGQVVLAYGKSWPATTLYPVGAITIEFKAGYGDSGSAVKSSIRSAILLLVGHLYENREETVGVGNVQRIPFGIEYLLWPDRVKGF